MEKVIVLGLSGCSYCNALVESLAKANIPFEFRDVDLKEHSVLADRMEALLQTSDYPMIIIEGIGNTKSLYRVNTIDEAKESSVSFGTKIGCVSTDSMVAIVEKYLK